MRDVLGSAHPVAGLVVLAIPTTMCLREIVQSDRL